MDMIIGNASVWAFRWCGCEKPGRYVVTCVFPGFFVSNFDAVMDDFGNLVKVET